MFRVFIRITVKKLTIELGDIIIAIFISN